MRISTRLFAGALAAGLLLTATATSASAKQVTIKDKRADVIEYANEDDQVGTILGKQASTDSGANITRFRVKHGKKSVSLTLNFADLSDQTAAVVYFRIDGEQEPKRFLINVSKKRGEIITFSGEDAACTVPLTTKYGPGGYIKTVFKRSCLDKPKKLKAAAMAYAGDFANIEGEDQPYFVDYASSGKYRSPSWTTWLKAG